MLEQKVVHSPFFILFYLWEYFTFFFFFTYESIAHTFLISNGSLKKSNFQWNWTFIWMDVVIMLKWQ